LEQLRDIQDALIGQFARQIEILEMRCVDPGNEVFHILDETPEVEVGKSGENNER